MCFGSRSSSSAARPVEDEERLRGPERYNSLSRLDMGDVDIDGTCRRDRRRDGIHPVDQRRNHRRRAHRGDGSDRQIEEITAGPLDRAR